MDTHTDRKLVLIADDYDSAADLMAEVLRYETTYESVAAHDGREAVRLADARRPDVAILDIDMPHLDGIAAAKAIRARWSGDVPFTIAMTGGSRGEEARASGHFDHVLMKPVAFDRIVALIEAGVGDVPGQARPVP